MLDFLDGILLGNSVIHAEGNDFGHGVDLDSSVDDVDGLGGLDAEVGRSVDGGEDVGQRL